MISPCLCNVYLHRLDRQWADRGHGVLVRFADDLLVMCRTREEAEAALASLRLILAELGLELKDAKTRIVRLEEGGEGWISSASITGGSVPTAQSMSSSWPAGPHAGRCSTPRTAFGITARERLLLPVEDIVQELNGYLRGWAGYFRYGNSARHFNLIEHHAHNRLALFMAKRHQRSRAYGWRLVTYSSPNRLGLISLSGTVVAPRPHRAWRGK